MHAVTNYGQRLRRALVLAVGICSIAFAAPAIPAHMPTIPLVSTAITAVAPANADAHIARKDATQGGQAYSYHVISLMNNTPSTGVYAASAHYIERQMFLVGGYWHYLEKWPLKRRRTGKPAGYCWLHAVLYGSYKDVHISKFRNSAACPFPSYANKATFWPIGHWFAYGWH